MTGLSRVGLLVLAMALPACVADQQGRPATSAATLPGEAVAAERFIELVRGNSMMGSTANGQAYTVHVAQDLTQRLRVGSGINMQTDQGRISAENGEICSRWTFIRGGAPACGAMRREGDTFRQYMNGRLWSTFTIRPGNPENL